MLQTISEIRTNTTICAISTPPGVGGIAVIRVSGPEAVGIVSRIWQGKSLENAPSHTAHLGNIIDPLTPDNILDQAVATLFRGPASFTGEDTVEISVHGSIYIQQQLINLLIRQGAILAEPGEFTRRAFASGRLDLAEAEAVADLIAADSQASHRIAINQMRGQFSRRLAGLRDELLNITALMELELDFSEEEVEFADRANLQRLATDICSEIDHLTATFSTGDAIRNGIPVAIVGTPNAGKSSLLNQLLNDSRAIVSDIPGTTRDTIEDTTNIDGITFRFIDTAGLRETADTIENLGIERAWQKIAQARIILWLTTPSEQPSDLLSYYRSINDHRSADSYLILLPNKIDIHPIHCDLQAYYAKEEITTDAILPISALTGEGIDALRKHLHIHASGCTTTSDVIITNARHYQALTSAATSLRRVIAALTPTPYPTPTDLIAQDLRETLHHLSTITGTITTPDILSHIFSRFCIGK